MRDGSYFINGVNGITGQYLTALQTAEDLRERMEGEVADRSRYERIVTQARGTLGLTFDIDPLKLEKAGWALVVPEPEEQMLRDALAPLLKHRQNQAGELAKVLTYRAGESRGTWLARHGVAAGDIVPAKVPFYLLVAGDCSALPFTFVHELAVEYAVGRIEFDDAAGYRTYAGNVVRYETGGAPATTRRAAFFGARHAFDAATQLSADYLVAPLADIEEANNAVRKTRFEVTRDIGQSATKQRLRGLLRDDKPSLLFTATHGVGWPAGHADQQQKQGALLCQDWPKVGTIGPEHYFTAADVPDDAHVEGLVSFHFACYGAGTPLRDRFPPTRSTEPAKISASPFIAALPKQLLLRGALACVGHVERAWTYSISPDNGQAQIGPFNNFIGHVLSGHPVGLAMRDFADRHAVLAVELANIIERIEYERIAPQRIADLWTQRNDAEAYLIVGDPAVRLRTAEIGSGGEA
jgi:hypothetical protein